MKPLLVPATVVGSLLASGCAYHSVAQSERGAARQERPQARELAKLEANALGTNFVSVVDPKSDEQTRLVQLFSDKAEYVTLVLQSDSELTLPKLRTWLYPRYPFGLGFTDTKALVEVAVVISKSGQVEEARVFETSDERFSYEALDAIRDWTFQPSVRRGVPAKVVMIVPIHFDGRQK